MEEVEAIDRAAGLMNGMRAKLSGFFCGDSFFHHSDFFDDPNDGDKETKRSD